VATLAGWSWTQGLVLGIAVSVASTVVLLRVLMDSRTLETASGHVAIGWLIVEDIITVLVLVVLPALAVNTSLDNVALDAAHGGAEAGKGVLWAAGIAILKLVALGAIVIVVGSRFVPWVLMRVARVRSRELFTLAVLVMSIAIATAAYAAFGASMALGAFMAGMLVGQSKFSHQAGSELLPLRDAFAVLFFVSVGMLFDFRSVMQTPLLLAGVLVVILMVKPLAAFLIVLLCRHTVHTGLVVAGGLAQIGEFSFILAEVARANGLIPTEAYSLLVAGAIISISLNPIVFNRLLALEPWIEKHASWVRWLGRRADEHGSAINAVTPHGDDAPSDAIVVGHGPVGRAVTEVLELFKVKPLIIEMNVDTVSELHNRGMRALYGDATRPEILKEACLEKARCLVITTPEPATRLAMIVAAREVNPGIHILTRARYVSEHAALREAGASVICCDELAGAAGLAEALLIDQGIPREQIEREIGRIRADWGRTVLPTVGDGPATK
jgi:CPA2 family monovalent cation:H+ antiporter-2